MRINLSPQQLAAFLHVAQVGSFSEAARRLGISQPALSRTIRLMEEVLGARLFDRDTRNVVLSPAGVELRPIAERLALEFDSAFSELSQFIAGRRGRISVAALPSIAAVLLPRAIARFRTVCPHVDFVIRDSLSESVLDAVINGQAEIGLTIQPILGEKLRYQPLIADEFGLVCRGDDLLAGDGPVPWSVFRRRPFIAMAPASSVRTITDAAFLQAGLAVPPLYECAFLGTAGNLVAAGLGITALPRLTLPLIGATDLAWRKLKLPLMQRSMGIVTRAGRSLTPAARDFLATLGDEAKQLR